MADSRRFGLDEWLCAVLLALMTIIAFVNVLGRYLFGYSLAFTEELTLNFFVYVVVLGAGIGYERLVHPRFASLVARFPAPLRSAATILAFLLGAGLLLVLVWVTVVKMYFDITLFQTQSAALGVPVWAYDGPVLFCVLLALRRMWRGLRLELGGHAPSEPMA
ncbi:MAG TPA: TRAP transporter small permease subunit [Arenicellales bacterium]|nr:TRAP transporter small permease subunit [Arenicellales bacterium]